MTTQATLDGGNLVEPDEDEVLKELTAKLEEIFQFDKRDLDFGMYRVLKLRHTEVEAFMAGLAGEVRGFLADAPAAERIEVSNHLVDFFSRYYQDGDFLSLPRRNETKPEYAIPYWGEEVLLHWANRDQYYIKTGRSFRVYEFQDEGGQYTIRFTVVEAETPLNNTRGEACYFIPAGTEYNETTRLLTVKFEYRPVTAAEKKESGSKVQEHFQEQAFSAVLAAAPDGLRPVLSRQAKRDDKRTLLQIHLNRYTAANREDFFIHKALGAFLRRELDFYLKNAVIRLDALTSGTEVDLTVAVRKATAIKSIANRVIEMLDTTETMQRRLFEKRKLVVSADYCMTLDRVPEELYHEIAENDAQVAEWKELFSVDVGDQSTLAGSAMERMKACPSLVLDTRHFGESFKDRLLASFNDLDEAVEGLMVKSENWQALNLLGVRYGGEIKCIYIDPPYNTGNDGFLYKDRYQQSSWLSMMWDRLTRSKMLLRNDGVIFINIDDNEVAQLKLILNNIFDTTNFRSEISWQKKYSVSNNFEGIASIRDYILVYSKSESFQNGLLPRTDESRSRYKNPDNDPRGGWKPVDYWNQASPEKRSNLVYPIKNPNTGEIIYPNKKAWKFEEQTHRQHVEEKRIWWGKDGKNTVPALKLFLSEVKDGLIPHNWWPHTDSGHTDEAKKEIENIFGPITFETPKPTRLIEKIIQISSEEQNQLVLDFFAGSGTTAHAVLNMNRNDGGHRKYILVEMGEHFATVMKPRIMKVMYAKTWKDGQPVLENGSPNGISHIFKYIALEQYEDTLANLVLPELRADERTLFDTAPGHLLTYLLDRAGSAPGPDATSFEHPFAVTLRLHRETLAHPDDGPAGSSQTRPRPVDLPETFAYLLGLHVIRRQAFHNDDRRYLAYLGQRDEGHIIVIWRDTTDLDYAADRTFINDTILPALRVGLTAPEVTLYINGEAWVENSRSIGPVFTGRLDTREE